MRNLKKQLLLVTITVFITLSFSPRPIIAENSSAGDGVDIDGGIGIESHQLQENMLNGYELASENSNMKLYVEKSSGKFALTNRRNGYIWWSNPYDWESDEIAYGFQKDELNSIIRIKIINEGPKFSQRTINSYSECVEKNGLEVRMTENGFKTIYTFTSYNIIIPIEITLADDHLQFRLCVSEIEDEEKARVHTVDVLPYFGAGSLNEEGYVFVPDGSGGIINFNNGKSWSGEYKENIYGIDTSFSTDINKIVREKNLLPVFGVTKGHNSLLGVITTGDSLGVISGYVSGMNNSYNNAYCSLKTRVYDTHKLGEGGQREFDVYSYQKEKLPMEYMEVRYYPLNDENSGYVGMAKRYRNYLTEEKGLKKAELHKSKLYVELYGAIKKNKNILGIPMKVTENLTTYVEALEILKKLKEDGVDNIALIYDNWSKGTIGNTITSSVELSGKLGGKRGFEKLVEYINHNNIDFYPSTNFMTNVNSVWFRLFKTAKRLNTSQIRLYSYKPSTYYIDYDKGFSLLLRLNLLGNIVNKYIDSSINNGLNYIGVSRMADILYTDYSQNNGTTSREQSKEYILGALNDIYNKMDGVLLKNPNAYALPYATDIVDLPIESSSFDIIDQTIPFIQIVLHGIIPYAGTAINLSDQPEMAILKSIETGSLLHYTMIYRDSSVLKETLFNDLYGIGYTSWIAKASEKYLELEEYYKSIEGSEIKGHEKVAHGVYQTEYENGVKVLVNYNDDAVIVDGMLIEGKGYHLLK